MAERLLQLLPWVLPPLLGAVIGYITNALAIRMLFRPLTEKRIFGIRVPLTPGIIPRRRYQLSESIGRMVSQKLLTEEVLVAKIETPEFQKSLRRSVGNLTTDLLGGTSPGAPAGTEVRESFEPTLEVLLSAFFGGEEFRRSAIHLSGRLAAGVLQLSASAVLPADDTIRTALSRLLDAAAGDTARAALSATVRKWVTDHMEANTPVRLLLGRQVVAGILVALPRLYEPVVETLLGYLKQPSTRAELSVSGRELLKHILKRLNMFQRFLVSAGQYQKNLNDNMPGIVDDVIATLERASQAPRNRRRVIAAARRTVVRWANSGLADLVGLLGIDPEDSVAHLIRELSSLLARPDVRVRIQDLAIRKAGEWAELAVGELIENFTGIGPALLTERAQDVVSRWTSSPERNASLAAGLRTFVGRLGSDDSRSGLGRLLPLDEDQKGVLDDWLAGVTATQIKRRVPELLRGIDIHAMVVNKIDALDVKSVEDLLLMVIAKHLKWINLFGALLGALIGGVQIVMNVLT